MIGRYLYLNFEGRINRRTYWLATLPLTISALGLVAFLSSLFTGDPFSPDIWQRPADKIATWLPVWLAYFGFLAWPSSALAVKRLHDRDMPAWIWFAYYFATIVIAVMPSQSRGGPEAGGTSQIVLITYLILGFYFLLELGVLRGTKGANQYGPDTVRPDYYGGDQTFWTLMVAPDGRISRQKWWLGVAISSGLLVLSTVLMSAVVGVIAGSYPEFQQNMQNPAWLDSPQARPIVMQMTIAGAVPGVLFMFASWSLIALGIKRLHDRGLSGWLIWLVVLPFVFLLMAPGLAQGLGSNVNLPLIALLLYLASLIWAVLQFGIFQGQPGPNEHGPDPLSPRS